MHNVVDRHAMRHPVFVNLILNQLRTDAASRQNDRVLDRNCASQAVLVGRLSLLLILLLLDHTIIFCLA